VHHASIAVSDMDRSIKFYRVILGLHFSLPPTEESGEEVSKGVGVPNARLKYAILQTPDNKGQVELVQYLNPVGKRIYRDNNDIGSMHIAFRVKDIDKAYEELKKNGVEFLTPPVKNPGGKGGFVYFRDPDGVTLELMED